jgi:hypothetical protein
MQTIPPAGVHESMLPPPPHRAKRAVHYTVAGLVLLGIAVALGFSLRPEESNVFSGRNDFEMGAAASRFLLGLSAVAQAVGLVYGVLSFKQAKGMSTLAFAVHALWLGAIGWWLYRGL